MILKALKRRSCANSLILILAFYHISAFYLIPVSAFIFCFRDSVSAFYTAGPQPTFTPTLCARVHLFLFKHVITLALKCKNHKLSLILLLHKDLKDHMTRLQLLRSDWLQVAGGVEQIILIGRLGEVTRKTSSCDWSILQRRNK